MKTVIGLLFFFVDPEVGSKGAEIEKGGVDLPVDNTTAGEDRQEGGHRHDESKQSRASSVKTRGGEAGAGVGGPGGVRAWAAKRFKQVTGAEALIWKTLMIAEMKFRPLNAPELLKEVADGKTCVDGIADKISRKLAACSRLHTD